MIALALISGQPFERRFLEHLIDEFHHIRGRPIGGFLDFLNDRRGRLKSLAKERNAPWRYGRFSS